MWGADKGRGFANEEAGLLEEGVRPGGLLCSWQDFVSSV